MKVAKKTLEKIIKEEIGRYLREEEPGSGGSFEQIEQEFVSEAEAALDKIAEGYTERFQALATQRVGDKIKKGKKNLVFTDKVRVKWGIDYDSQITLYVRQYAKPEEGQPELDRYGNDRGEWIRLGN